MRARSRKGVYLIVPLRTLELVIRWECGQMVMVVFSVFSFFFVFGHHIFLCAEGGGLVYTADLCGVVSADAYMCMYISVYVLICMYEWVWECWSCLIIDVVLSSSPPLPPPSLCTAAVLFAASVFDSEWQWH